DKLKKGDSNLAEEPEKQEKKEVDLEALLSKLVDALGQSKPEPKAQSKEDKDDKEDKSEDKEPEAPKEEVEPQEQEQPEGAEEEPDDKYKDRDSKKKAKPGVVEVPVNGEKKKKRADEDLDKDETPDTSVPADTEIPSDGDVTPDDDPDKDIRSMKGNENMTTVLKSKKDEQLRSFEEYMKSKGQVRDGLVEEDGKAVIPEDILKAYTIPNDPNNLAQY